MPGHNRVTRSKLKWSKIRTKLDLKLQNSANCCSNPSHLSRTKTKRNDMLTSIGQQYQSKNKNVFKNNKKTFSCAQSEINVFVRFKETAWSSSFLSQICTWGQCVFDQGHADCTLITMRYLQVCPKCVVTYLQSIQHVSFSTSFSCVVFLFFVLTEALVFVEISQLCQQSLTDLTWASN